MVVVHPDVAYGNRLFVQVRLHFRYACEMQEFADAPFKNVLPLAHEELYPLGDKRDGYGFDGVFKKFADTPGSCPFSLALPRGAPPSLFVHNVAGVTGEPCGINYSVTAFMAHDANDEPDQRSAISSYDFITNIYIYNKIIISHKGAKRAKLIDHFFCKTVEQK